MTRTLRSKSGGSFPQWKRLPSLALSDRDRRALYVGFMSVSILIVLARGVPLWLAWTRAAQDDARAATMELARADALLSSRRMLADSLSARGGRLVSVMPVFLAGTNSEAAGATLAGVISQAAADYRM
jgi:hypothetical protein